MKTCISAHWPSVQIISGAAAAVNGSLVLALNGMSGIARCLILAFLATSAYVEANFSNDSGLTLAKFALMADN